MTVRPRAPRPGSAPGAGRRAGRAATVASSSTRVCGSARTSRASASCCAWAGDSVRPPGADRGVQAVGQVGAQSSASTAARAAADLVVGGVRAGQHEVVAQRAREDVVFLGDQGDVAAQLVQRELDQRRAADRDRAGARRVDAGEQPAQRGLAGAGRPDHGQPLARAQRQVDAVQHVAAGAVGVADVLRGERSPSGVGAGARPVGGDLGDAEQPGQRGAADLELVEPGQQPVERVDELLDVERGGGDLAEA